jgi:hypothetical protein
VNAEYGVWNSVADWSRRYVNEATTKGLTGSTAQAEAHAEHCQSDVAVELLNSRWPACATGCARLIPGRELAATGVRLGRVFVSWRRTNGVVTT